MSKLTDNLHKAKRVKNDEFYTRYEDIEAELKYYVDEFKDKIIYLPCDDPDKSQFTKYFLDNFDVFKLKALVSTGYHASNGLIKTREKTVLFPLQSDGDFNSKECTAFRDKADMIITNPPFSKYTQFYPWAKCKKFILISPMLNIAAPLMFTDYKYNKVFWGHNQVYHFIQPDGTIKLLCNAGWVNNIGDCHHKDLILTKTFNDIEHEYFDNMPDILNVNRCKDIPYDYNGIMGVPATILRYDFRDEFELIACIKEYPANMVNGVSKFTRLIIRRK